jgi:surfactin synthase thioesterase subunit
MILPAIRTDYQAVETYRFSPGPPLSCPIVALTGDSDPKAGIDAVRGWWRQTTAGFDLHVFPGGHFYLSDQVAEVSTVLASCA